MNSRASAAVAALIVLVFVFGATADAARPPKPEHSDSVVSFTQPDIEWIPSAEDCTQYFGDICARYELDGLPTFTPRPTRTAQAIRSVALSAQVVLPSGAGLGLAGSGSCAVAVFAHWGDSSPGPRVYTYRDSISLVDDEVTASSSARTYIAANTVNLVDLNDGGILTLAVSLYCDQNVAPTEALTLEDIRWLVSSVGA